jgi:drug/metabolite transporter (DMT)-like permease
MAMRLERPQRSPKTVRSLIQGSSLCLHAGFAAQSLLAALGVVQFLSNMVFARFLNHEHITKRVMFATALVVSGCILLVLFGNHDSPIITAHELLKLYSK